MAEPSVAQPLVQEGSQGSGSGVRSDQLRASLKEREQEPEPKPTFAGWARARPAKFACLCFLIIACIVLVAVVPPVCVLKGCGAGSGQTSSSGEPNRLIVNFDEIGKTVKSRVPPLLWRYIVEQGAVTSGIQVVSFADEEVYKEVLSILNRQSDVANLLRDTAQYKPNPSVEDVGLGATLSGATRRSAQAASGVTDALLASRQYPYPYNNVDTANAWAVTEGERDVVVAVIDSGCDLNHPDLKDNLWINTREIPDNGIDDDGNGYIDDVYGYDFAGNCPDDYPRDTCGPRPYPQDQGSHGSHCAGIIAAVRNNGVGTAGIAPRVKVMCLKVTTPEGTFYTGHIMKAYDYATRMGAHIVSCSFGPQAPILKPDPVRDDVGKCANETNFYIAAFKPMVEKNMLIVAAAGNENTDIDRLDAVNTTYNPCFMGKYFPDNVLCVMATNEQDARWAEKVSNVDVGTNYGIKYAHIGAPGRAIWSTVPNISTTNPPWQQWMAKTGSSMATPLVAGVGALVVSVLGRVDSGNYFKGKEARQILVSSGDRLSTSLPVSTGRRVNAASAVRMAIASRDGFISPVAMASFVQSAQSVMTPGFNETYYAGDLGIRDRNDWDRQTIVDSTTRVGDSRFDAFKVTSNCTLVVKALLNLPLSGIYSLRVSSNASSTDLAVFVGQVPVNLTGTNSIRSAGSAWYEFEIRYRNPAAAIDIRMAAPTSQAGSASLSYLSLFYVTTPVQPRNYYYAPDIALSSVFQVLSRTRTAPITTGSILNGTFPRLALNQPYNYSSVVSDISYSSPGQLVNDLYPASARGSAAVPTAVVGMVHTRLRAPTTPMRFRLTCDLCALYINELRVVDVYNSLGGSATRVSSCITFGSALMHDLVIRFGTNDTSRAVMVLGWLPCTGDSGQAAVSITTHVMNNLFWNPSSGVAAYVPGIQCDVWSDLGSSSTYPIVTAPLFKFRFPTALAQTPSGATNKKNLPSYLYGAFINSNCNVTETSTSSCSYAAAFSLLDIITGMQNGYSGTLLEQMYMRCWFYMNRGFTNGYMNAESSANNIFAYTGSQTIFASENVAPGVYNRIPVAPTVTFLPSGMYQLVAMEWRRITPITTVGFYDGSPSTYLTLNFTSALLPIPVVAPRTTTSVATASASGRRLQQLKTDDSGYRAEALGASAWSMRQVPASNGLVAEIYNSNSSSFYERTSHLGKVVLNNFSDPGVTFTTGTGAFGLAGMVGLRPTPINPPYRYVRCNGFILTPRDLTVALGSFTLRTWRLKVGDAKDQAVAITMGNVTVRNAVEVPATTVATTITEINVPPGYIPTQVVARSARTFSAASLDVSLVDPNNRNRATDVGNSMWYTCSTC